MKRNILMAATGSFMALGAGSLAAQETPPTETTTATTATTVTTTEPTAKGNGAAVVRQDTTVATTTPNADGSTSVETTTEAKQTVATDADGKKPADVEHAKGEHHGHHDKPAEEPEIR